MATEIKPILKAGRPPLVESPILREICLACARLYYDPNKKLRIADIAEVFGISDQTLRNRVRTALLIEGPEGNEIRRMAEQSKKRRIKP